MEVNVLAAAMDAARLLADPACFGFLALGVIVGLLLGVLPGLNGLVGLALLLPFTFDMEIVSAMAFLLGVGSVVVTSDTIPAVLFGVPGTVGSAATILDGHPLAERGRAAEALGAGFSASLIGGIFGALLLGVSLPILRPFMMMIATPELLAICIFGLSLVVVLSGSSLSRGIVACCLGIAFSTIGDDGQTATLRWTFDALYLYDGIPLVPLVLGIFAVPQLAALSARQSPLPSTARAMEQGGQFQGLKATLKNRFLVFRCSSIGSVLGAVPGIGISVIDWVAYGHAKRTERGAMQSFGTGDIRGVIASESSNNAKEGGALIPTLIFGIPGSASMVLLLGAFMSHGIVPGPGMLGENLSITYSMVWSVALANILGAGLCFLFSGHLARVANIRVWVLVPLVSCLVVVGALQGSRHWADLAVLMLFGFIGLIMKHLGWSRPALVLGFVLGGLLERYAFISVSRYDHEWLFRPIVVAVLAMTALGLVLPALRQRLKANLVDGVESPGREAVPGDGWIELAFTAGLFALFCGVIASASGWDPGASQFPVFNAGIALALLAYIALRNLRKNYQATTGSEDTNEEGKPAGGPSDIAQVTPFLGWFVALLLLAWIAGVYIAVTAATFAYIRFVGREGWLYSALVALGFLAVNIVVFGLLLDLNLPVSLLP